MADWTIDLTADDALRAQGTQQASPQDSMRFAAQSADVALNKVRELVRPVVLARESAILGRDGPRLTLGTGTYDFGIWAAARLCLAESLVVAVCTIGSSLEERCRELVASDIVAAVTLDALGSAALENLSGQARQLLRAEACAEGLMGAVCCHPGSKYWPTEVAQPLVFSLLNLNPASQDDVRLLPSMVMRPLKSLTFLLGLTRGLMAREDSCGTCSASRMCRYRLTPVGDRGEST